MRPINNWKLWCRVSASIFPIGEEPRVNHKLESRLVERKNKNGILSPENDVTLSGRDPRGKKLLAHDTRKKGGDV